jgi:glycosyltransferase involved in cell wall biosynthesis
MSLATRAKLEAEDYLRWHPATRGLVHRRTLRKAFLPKSQVTSAILRSIDQLCVATRVAPNSEAMQRAEEMILDGIRSLNMSNVNWRDFVPDVEKRRIERAVVLKPRIGPKERGVVFVSFEDQWARLLWNCNLKEFAESYTLVVSPTWSPPHSLINCLFPSAYPGPIFCLISNTRDLDIFPRLSNRYVMVPLFASSWVNPDLYKPLPFDKKDISIFMLANFGKYKRHFLLFKALRGMPASVRVLLIGQENGDRTGETIMAEARAYGVENRFELLVNATNSAVVDAFCRSKTTVIFSHREGSCVAAVESMFANAPVGIFEDAEIGSRVYINESTGRFFRHHNLGDQLMDFIANAEKYSPRAFAEENISCFRSTKTLNESLKAHALAMGQEWTQDIVVHHWRPDPQLLSASDRAQMQPGYDDIRKRFGISLGTN